jgi:outer membrane protein
MRYLELVILAVPLFGSPAIAAPVSLKETALYAIEHSPSLDSSKRQALIAQMQHDNAGAAFLPTLDFTSSHGLQRNYPLVPGSTPWASNFSFNLAENLYDNGDSIAGLRISRLQDEIAQLVLSRDRDKLLLDVINAFFTYDLACKNLEIQQEQHAVLKLQVELVKEAYQQGVKTRKDYLRFQTQFNRADIDLVNAKDAVQKAELELNRLTGVPLNGSEKISYQVDERRPEPPPPFHLRVEDHRDFRISELQKKVQDLTAGKVERKIWPEVGLAAGATLGSSNYIDTGQTIGMNQTKSWNVLLTLKYNIFDWGLRRRNAEIAAEQAAVQANTYDNDLLTLRSDLEKLSLDLRRQQENFHLSEDLLKLERNNLALITNEYQEGKVQYLDYITSLQNFANARSTYYSSLYDLKRAVLTQRYHEGTLYEAIIKN